MQYCGHRPAFWTQFDLLGGLQDNIQLKNEETLEKKKDMSHHHPGVYDGPCQNEAEIRAGHWAQAEYEPYGPGFWHEFTVEPGTSSKLFILLLVSWLLRNALLNL